eukprot:GEMP01011465.1.p1 GENE.GEMP01011465.1~~GEMP01011465.1.p1  ORF type:complete len:931 (-),score=203.91 GEMP01011465.1:253-3045(-)
MEGEICKPNRETRRRPNIRRIDVEEAVTGSGCASSSNVRAEDAIFERSRKIFEIVEFDSLDEIKQIFETDVDDIHWTMDCDGQNLMFPAVKRKKQILEVCEYLHSRGVACNFKDFERLQSPLFIAIANFHAHRNIHIFDFLLDRGCSVDERDKMRSTPLFEAIQFGHTSIIEAFIGRRADVNAVDMEGNTIIHVAAELGNKTLLKYLLDLSDLDTKSKLNVNRQAPLNLCTNEECVGILLDDSSAAKDDEKEAILTSTCKNGPGQTPLIRAVLDDRLNTAEALIASGFNADEQDEQGRTALHYAVNQGNVQMLCFLLRHNADTRLPDNSGVTPRQAASGSPHLLALMEIDFYALVKSDKLRAIKSHILAGTHSRADGNSLLFAACERASDDDEVYGLITFLTDELPDVDVNNVNANGITPLIYACQLDNLVAVDALLRCGASINGDVTRGTQNALGVAKERGSANVAKYLQKVVDDKQNAQQSVCRVRKNALIGVRSARKRQRGEPNSPDGSVIEDGISGSPSHLSVRSNASREGNLKYGTVSPYSLTSTKVSATKPFFPTGEKESSSSSVTSSQTQPRGLIGVIDLSGGTSAASSSAPPPYGRQHVDVIPSNNSNKNTTTACNDVASLTKHTHLRLLLVEQRPWDEILAYIESQNPTLHATDQHKQNLLFCAATWKHGSRAVEYFIDRSVDLHLEDVHKQTPLFGAVRLGSVHSVRALLQAGADANHIDEEGNCPLSYVQRWKNSEHRMTLERLLVEFGAFRRDGNKREGFPGRSLVGRGAVVKRRRMPLVGGDPQNRGSVTSGGDTQDGNAVNATSWTEEDELAFFGMTFAQYRKIQWNIRIDIVKEPSLSNHNANAVITFFDPSDDANVIPLSSEAYKHEFRLAEQRIPGFKEHFCMPLGAQHPNHAPFTRGSSIHRAAVARAGQPT